MRDEQLKFQLLPILGKTTSAHSRDGGGTPTPGRVFTFETNDSSTKRSWLIALGELDDEIDDGEED
jgi:hypothetical protein